MTIPDTLRDRDLPLPNVYFVTVQSAFAGTFHFYIAADDSTAAIKKASRLCAEDHNFRPYRGTSDIKLRRYRLGDYLEAPEGLQVAYETASRFSERDTVAKLAQRRHEVTQLLEGLSETQQRPDFDGLEAMLAEELRKLG